MRPPSETIALLPRALDALSHWRTLRWYVLLFIPHAAADVHLGMRAHSALTTVFMIIVGALLAAVIVTDLCTGVTSSNWGTYLRARQPARYWCSLLVSTLFYLGMIAAALFAPIAR